LQMKISLVILSTLLFSLPPLAQGEEPVVFGVMDIDFPPYQYIVNGTQAGPDADIISEVFRRLDEYNLTYKLRPVKRVALEIKNGNIDITAVFKTPEREKFALFTHTPIHWSIYKIAVMKGNEFAFNRIEDLYGKRLGMMMGNKISLEFDRAVESGKIDLLRVPSFTKTLLLLKNQRVKAIVGSATITHHLASKLGMADWLVMLPHPIRPPKAFRFMISKNSTLVDPQHLRNRLEDTLAQMLKDGTFDKIYANHGLTFERNARSEQP